MNPQNIPTMIHIGELARVHIEQMLVRAAHAPTEELDGDMTIAARPTWYGGVTFRSALEASWAATLDTLGVEWAYEPETITLPSGTVYVPDFWLPQVGIWIEVKGPGVPRVEKAHALAEARACACEGRCGCAWPGGELVLIGHPAEAAAPSWDANGWRRRTRHRGHPAWTLAGGGRGRAYFTACPACDVRGWVARRTPPTCRACRRPLRGGHLYRSGDDELVFVDAAGFAPQF
ncbi:hypothetical protein GCM10027294_25470 [Marinactinospora endophytica]